jgi:lysophospholipase L1-like esterase
VFLAKMLVAAAVLGAAALGSPAHAGPPPTLDPPKQFYLALGDSVAYGYEQAKFEAGLPAAAFDTGYVDDLAARMRRLRPGLTVVNFGCPRESTGSFVTGPCPLNALGFPLHDPFAGSQLGAATAFLRAHRGRVSPITLTLGGNDVSDFVERCGGDFICIANRAPAEIATISSNVRIILARLRAAAPDAEIVVTGAWDGNLVALAFADPLYTRLNAAMARAAASERARFADPMPVFNPHGDLAVETAALCRFTGLCVDGDAHPSDAGYAALAGIVWNASGYARPGG